MTAEKTTTLACSSCRAQTPVRKLVERMIGTNRKTKMRYCPQCWDSRLRALSALDRREARP
jgi:hypothetical protein